MARVRDVTVILHSPHETLGTFEQALIDQGCRIHKLDAPAAKKEDWERADESSLLIVMGGAMGVYEAHQHPFLTAELELLRRRIVRGAATLGVCLGAQLLAEAAGSKVFRSGRHEIGWFPVTPTAGVPTDPLFGKMTWSSSLPMFHWHGDTFDLPKKAELLLSSERFVNQAYRIGEPGTPLYGIQFHPEIDRQELLDWLSSEDTLLYGTVDGIQSKQEILDGGKRFGVALEQLSHRLITQLLLIS